MALLCVLMFSLWFATTSAAVQDNISIVPDVTGLSIPEAAAALNRAGLQLGTEKIIAIHPASDDPGNVVVEQSPQAGDAIEPGSMVDIAVTRLTNAYFLYDDNDLTLVNTAAGLLDLTDIMFSAVGTPDPVEFNSSAWATNLAEGRCGQVWSVARLSSKEISGCSTILWMTASSSSQHFWTYTSGAAQFSVVQGNVIRATCPVAQTGSQDEPLRCDMVFDVVYPDEHVDYIYLAYTIDRLIVHNQTVDRWMSLDDTVLRDSNSRDIDLQLLDIFSEARNQSRIAPSTCILFAMSADSQPPEPCQVIGQITPDEPFWLQPFRVIGRDNIPRMCEAAEQGVLMICVMLR